VVWSFVYLALCRLCELMVLCWRSADAKEVEILVLRHPADSPAPPAPTASAPAPGPCAACRPEPPPAQAPMVDLRGHARDAASMAPSHGAPTLDLSNSATRPTADSRSAAELDRAAGHRESTVGLPAHPRGATAAWLPSLGQLHRQGPARQRPPAGTATGLHHLAVVPTPAGSRHPRLRLPHRGHRVPATAVRAVLHPASQPACASRRRHHQPPQVPGSPNRPVTSSPPSKTMPRPSGS
jgi:hypothetical protein